MAKQNGIIKLKGTIGDLTFYKSKDGHMAREKGGIDAQRIARDPAFQRTRENNAEFGRAGKAGKLMRQALRQYLQIASDSRVTSRLTTELLRIVKTDEKNDRGERTVSEGAINLLLGFDFNLGGRLSSTLFLPFVMKIDRAGGTASVNLDSFVPNKDIAFPQGTTHVRLFAGLVAIDWLNEQFSFNPADTSEIEMGPQAEPAKILEMNFEANTDKDLFLVLGIEFTQDVNGKKYPLKSGSYNAMSVIAVSRKDILNIN
ncbi:MAG: hypothetical protein ACNS60_15975 [Candidatus Cyclobacteriaceae bacterium M2_1C_046]